ncbi:MAG: hypothetical protein H7833_09715 [Magnetococcus sp. DMHC-1]|nr:hypothetical protein [Magnetococcales bacterium]
MESNPLPTETNRENTLSRQVPLEKKCVTCDRFFIGMASEKYCARHEPVPQIPQEEEPQKIMQNCKICTVISGIIGAIPSLIGLYVYMKEFQRLDGFWETTGFFVLIATISCLLGLMLFPFTHFMLGWMGTILEKE